jgi:phosphoribosylformylglycinamidine synthase
MNVLLGKPPKMHRDVTVATGNQLIDLTGVDLQSVVSTCSARPWRPRLLITIGDRTVGGMTHRDQMVARGRCRWLTAR